MTTYSVPAKNGGLVFALFLSSLLALGILLWDTSAGVTVNNSGASHAELNHPEAPLIRQCLKDSQTDLRWSTKDRQKWFLPCKLPDGRWGFQILDKVGREITSFIKGNGSWQEFTNYMSRQGAFKYNGPVPWR